jgi:hypothetical protein
MSYSNFTLEKIEKLHSLKEQVVPLFDKIKPVQPSSWLLESLNKGKQAALKSEKSRSEMIISPILLEILDRNNYAFSLFSGVTLDVNIEQGLNGECDFLLSRNPNSYIIHSPIFTVLEAKQHIIENSIGQCVAQMVGARLFNEQEKEPIDTIYGCVTTGTEWQFIKLEGSIILIDSKRYFVDNLSLLLGVLQTIIDQYIIKN